MKVKTRTMGRNYTQLGYVTGDPNKQLSQGRAGGE